MTQKTLGYVELEWTCPKCGTRNKGTARSCTACGAPQPDEVQFEQSQQQTLITDTAKIEAAAAGADVHCPFCGTRNPANAKLCSQCGGDLSGGEKRISGTVVGAYQPGSAPRDPVICPNCGASNPPDTTACSACGASLTAAPAAPFQPGASLKPAARPALRWPLIVGAALLGICLLAVVSFLAFSLLKRDNLTGRVAEVNWVRSLAIEEFGAVDREGWKDAIPAGASIQNCSQRYHHTQADPGPNSREVCGTPYTRDTGSGMGQVVQDCQYEVYLDYCTYTVQDWHPGNSVELQGNDLNPSWPAADLGSNQRVGGQQEDYTVIFRTDNGEYAYHTPDLQEFQQFTRGSEWVLTVNGLGQLVSVQAK